MIQCERYKVYPHNVNKVVRTSRRKSVPEGQVPLLEKVVGNIVDRLREKTGNNGIDYYYIEPYGPTKLPMGFNIIEKPFWSINRSRAIALVHDHSDGNPLRYILYDRDAQLTVEDGLRRFASVAGIHKVEMVDTTEYRKNL